MYQLVLSPLALIIGAYIGFSISRRFQNRVKQLELCSLLLQRMKVYLEYEKTPTKTIIQKLTQSESLSKLVFLNRCNQKLEYNMNFPLMWQESIEESKKELALEKDDYIPLMQLSEVIGSYDATAQMGGIVVIEKVIKQQIDIAIEQNKTTGKLYRSLGILGGIATAILIL